MQGLHARLAEQQQQCLVLQALLNASHVLHHDLSVDHQCQVIMALAREQTGARWAAVLLHDPVARRLNVFAVAGLPQPPPLTLPLQQGLLSCLLRVGDPFPVADGSGAGPFTSLFAQHGLGVLAPEIWVPLVARSHLWGVLSLGGLTNGMHGLDEHAQIFLRHLGRVAASSLGLTMLDRHRLALEQQRLHLHQRLSIVLDVNRSMTSGLDVTAQLALCLEQAMQATHAEHGSWMLLDETRDQLVVRMVRGLEDRVVQDAINRGAMKCTPLHWGQGVAGTVLATGEPVRLPNGTSTVNFEPVGESHVHSILCVPLRVEGSTVGVMNLTNRKGSRGFDPQDQDLALLLSNQAAWGIASNAVPDLAISDQESGLLTARFIGYRLEQEIRRARRYTTALCVLVAELQVTGRSPPAMEPREWNPVLVRVAERMRGGLRLNVDLVGRLKTDQLVLVLPQTNGLQAVLVAERLRHLVGDEPIPGSKTATRLRMRVGVAQWDAETDEVAEEVLRRASNALRYTHLHEGTPVRLAPQPTSRGPEPTARTRGLLSRLALSPLRARMAAMLHNLRDR